MDPLFGVRLELLQTNIKNARKAMEDFCLTLQRMQLEEQIERNRRLMKAGLIEFDDYEEVE